MYCLIELIIVDCYLYCYDQFYHSTFYNYFEFNNSICSCALHCYSVPILLLCKPTYCCCYLRLNILYVALTNMNTTIPTTEITYAPHLLPSVKKCQIQQHYIFYTQQGYNYTFLRRPILNPQRHSVICIALHPICLFT